MCKFNNRLFVFSILYVLALLMVGVLAKPIQEPQQQQNSNEELNELMALTALLAPQDNYDLHYDQRQKGEENYRLKLDGFFIGIPQEESSALLLLTDDIFESIGEYGTNDDYLLAFGKNKSPAASAQTSSSNGDSSQNHAQSSHNSQNSQTTLNNRDVPVVEIPAPKKHLEARQSLDTDDTEELPGKAGSRTRAYISNLLNLLKRGRKN